MLMGFLCPPQSPFGFRTSWDLVRVGQFSFVVDCNLLKVLYLIAFWFRIND